MLKDLLKHSLWQGWQPTLSYHRYICTDQINPQELMDCSVTCCDPLAQPFVDKISCIQFLLGLYSRSDSIRWHQDADDLLSLYFKDVGRILGSLRLTTYLYNL